ncbi:UbiA family prenyltransferase [Micromonospora sp. MA102]|uniref:UbiA family prenyltransferase n=1 Tax=Micromonospora sp. MA102 TaxID=2952755 RepID=UPI0021C93BCC|nr:UbiA family prenyltransferase [Micromonospora sp. MA102]
MSMSVLGLVRASHPEPAAAVTVVAGLLARAVGHGAGGVAVVSLTVLASQLAVGWSNDLIDADRDATVGRTDKPVATGAVSRRVLARATVPAAVATPLLALALGPAAALCATLGLVAALLYNWPLKSTPVSVLPYAVSFGALPAFVVLALPGTPAPPVWLVAAAALLGAGAHFANVLPDLADDARTGVRGLPHRLGPAGSRAAAAGLLLAATVALVVGPPGPPSWAGLAAVAAAVGVPAVGWYVGRTPTGTGARPVAAFRAVLVVALIDVVLLVASGRVV